MDKVRISLETLAPKGLNFERHSELEQLRDSTSKALQCHRRERGEEEGRYRLVSNYLQRRKLFTKLNIRLSPLLARHFTRQRGRNWFSG